MSIMSALIKNQAIGTLVTTAIEKHKKEIEDRAAIGIEIIRNKILEIEGMIKTMSETGALLPNWEIKVHKLDCAHIVYEEEINDEIDVLVGIAPHGNYIGFRLDYDGPSTEVEKLIAGADYGCTLVDGEKMRNGYELIIR